MSFDDYVADRKYVRNVSPKTLLWYKDIQRAFGPYLKTDSPQLFRESAMTAVRFHLERGVKPVFVNSWLTGVRAYGIWLWKEGKLPEKPRIELLKYERKILATLTHNQIERLLKFPLSKSAGTRRAHLVALTILDCGLRASEVLGLTKADLDIDNLVFKVRGKGGKQRLVPFSVELRKHLFRLLVKGGREHTEFVNPFLFGTKNNTKVSVRNLG